LGKTAFTVAIIRKYRNDKLEMMSKLTIRIQLIVVFRGYLKFVNQHQT